MLSPHRSIKIMAARSVPDNSFLSLSVSRVRMGRPAGRQPLGDGENILAR
jgi:hypothetical protein